MRRHAVLMVVGMSVVLSGFAQELKVLEVPKGGKIEERQSWKAGNGFPSGAAIDNGRIVLLVVPGANVKIAGAKGVASVDLCGKIRNTVLPDFFGFDAMLALVGRTGARGFARGFMLQRRKWMRLFIKVEGRKRSER